jgi:hypothetical protein
MENKTYTALYEEISKMPVIDCHEHLMPEKMRLERKADFFSVILEHYTDSDLASAGMPEWQLKQLKGNSMGFEEKAKIFMPFWERISNTGYSRALKLAVKELYEADEINEETLPEINRKMLAAEVPGMYTNLLQNRLNIQYCLWDQSWSLEPEKDDFFRLALRLDDILYIRDYNDVAKLEEKYNITIKSPGDIKEMLEVRITAHKNKGLTAIKSAMAYQRTLMYEPVSETEATLALDKMLRHRFSEEDAKTLQDHLMYTLAEKAYWHDLPVQIHTGLLEGCGNNIANANPALLSHLIQANPNTQFDLLHGGYPYGGLTAAMTKMFPNVFLNMAWTHSISPEYAKRQLSEWLDSVPASKILGFGGDYIYVEGVCGQMMLARANIAHVLAEKVDNGIFTYKEALRYARMILRDNAAGLYK